MAAGSGSGSGSTKPASAIALKPGEKLREPVVEMPWIPAGHDAMKVTVVDLDSGNARLVVWNKDGRHDVVHTKRPCIEGEHGTELVTGAKNTVLFRCESGSEARGIAADEWLIRWTDKKDYPTIYRHWRGARGARTPKWAGARTLYGKPKPEPKASRDKCCCQWDDEDLRDEPPTIQSRDYCKGSAGQHGHCVAESKCESDEEGDP